jgi:hypothetical protein
LRPLKTVGDDEGEQGKRRNVHLFHGCRRYFFELTFFGVKERGAAEAERNVVGVYLKRGNDCYCLGC